MKDGKAGCYVLDNNGYVVVSADKEETGKFFGDVHQWLMKRFVNDGLYKKVKIYNYQAVCEERDRTEKTDGNSGSILQGVSILIWFGFNIVSNDRYDGLPPFLQPIKHFISIFKWFGRVLTWAFIHLAMITPAYSNPDYEEFGLYTSI